MESVAVASLEEYRHAKHHTEFRHKLPQEFDRWLERVEQEMNTPQPTLTQLTEVVFRLREEWTQVVTEALLQQAYAAEQEQETARCPVCSQMLRARKNEERVVETIVGALSVNRPYFYCGTCRQGGSPHMRQDKPIFLESPP
jgi:hypothetical protein